MQSIEGERRKFKDSAYLNLNDVFQVFLVCDVSSAVKTSRLSERKSFYLKTQAALFEKSINEKLQASCIESVFFFSWGTE